MVLLGILKLYLLFAFYLCMTATQACNLSNKSATQLILGSDGIADHATLGYALNHFSLIVNNMSASMEFYGKVMGMRHIFTFHASNAYEIVYMGYAQGGKNGTGFQTGEELYSEKTNSDGLLELLAPVSCGETSNFTASTKSASTFSHVGIVVPDVAEAQNRMTQFGVKTLKPLGEDIDPGSAAARAYGVGSSLKQARAVAAGLEVIGFKDFLLVADPDGNLVEIQAQT